MFTAEEKAYIKEVADKVKVYFPNLSHKNHYGEVPHGKSAHILSHYTIMEAADVYNLGNEGNGTFTFIKTSYTGRAAKLDTGGTDIQVVATKRIDKDYGRLIIRPEGLLEKLREIFFKIEIDFEEYKTFSSQYYFLAEDTELGKQFITPKRAQLLTDIPDLHIEVIRNSLIAKFNNQVTERNFYDLIQFIKAV